MFECVCQSIDWAEGPEQPLTDEEMAGAEILEPGHPLAIDTTADVLVEEAGFLTLGPHTLSRLLASPFSELSEAARSSALQTLTRFADYVDGLAAELTSLIAGPAPSNVEARRDDFCAHEVSVATRCSVYAADAKISFARDLTERLQATADAMAQGRISERQARHLSEETRHLEVDVARELEAKVLKFSHRQDIHLFRLSVRRWLAKLDPAFTARATAARNDCNVEHSAGEDGTGSLFIRGPLEITTEISMALTAYAAKTKPELGGSAAQRKLAGLRDIAEQYLASPGCPKHHGRLPVLNIVTDLPTTLGIRNNPAEIPGVGAIPADAVRWLLADGAPLRRLIIDPDNGQLLDYGRTTYTVPPALADLLITKHVTSTGPHSHIDATSCDIDHNQPWDNDGPTDPLNTTPVDRRWHRAKTHANWTNTKNQDTGVITWRSPTGLTSEIHPYDYRAGP